MICDPALAGHSLNWKILKAGYMDLRRTIPAWWLSVPSQLRAIPNAQNGIYQETITAEE
jgi:hypothetical protein